MKEAIFGQLREKNVWHTEETDLDKALPGVKVVFYVRAGGKEQQFCRFDEQQAA